MIIKERHLKLMQKIAHQVWDKYDDKFGYRSEKQALNASIPTKHPDNIWFFWNQFDSHNHREFLVRLVMYKQCQAKKDLLVWIKKQLLEEAESIEKLRKAGIEI